MADTRAIGVDLGGTKVLAGVVDEAGQVAQTTHLETPTGSQAELLDGLEKAVRTLLSPGIAAVCFGVPSRIDQRTGVAHGAVNIPLHELRFREEMEARLGLPVGV